MGLEGERRGERGREHAGAESPILREQRSSGLQRPGEEPFFGPRNRGGKKVITFFAGRSRLKTAGGVVIASDDGAAPGGCYRTSLPRGNSSLFLFYPD